MKIQFADFIPERQYAPRRAMTASEKDVRAIKRFLKSGNKYMVLNCSDKTEHRTVYARIGKALREHRELECVRFARGMDIYVARKGDVNLTTTVRKDGRTVQYVS